MRRKGEGTVILRKDGRWQASLRVGDKRHTLYAKTEREAHTKLRELRRQTELGITPSKRTLSDLVKAWLEHATLKPSTIVNYRKLYATYVVKELGDKQLSSITPDQIQRLYGLYTPSIARHIHSLLHRAFAVAVLWEWLPSNPCDRVFKPAHQAERKTLWTRPELDTFLTGAVDHWLYPLWVVLIATGMRIGEALALHWEAVSPDSLKVLGTLHRLEGEWVISGPKSVAGERTIILPPIAVLALERQAEQQARWRKADLVFTSQTGQPLHHSTPVHALARECERLGLPVVTPHGLRHLHASLLLAEGVPVPAVSARLGHASPRVTLGIYAHVMPGQDVEVAQIVERTLTK